MKPSLRLTSATLFFCIFLGLFTEVLLAPFYPQFFRKVFGVEDLSYTGYYIFICRLTVVAISPLWGLFARWIEVKWLLYCGQAGAAIMTALMATANSAEQFLGFTVGLLLFKSSYLLVYPLIIQLAEEEKRPTIAGTYQAVFHGAIVSATVAGAWMVNQQAPLSVFYGIALVDLFQLGLCFFALRGVSTRKAGTTPSKQPEKAVGDHWKFILAMGIVVFTFQLANQSIRPYFTQYVTAAEPFGVSLFTSSFLFLIPSVMAVTALPYIRKVGKPQHLPLLYGFGLTLLIISLYSQGFANNLPILVISRLVYGFFFAVTQAALELQLFGSSSQKRLHFNYSLAIAFANAGHLAAPLFASWLVESYSLATPLLAAGTICVLNLVFTQLTIFRSRFTEKLKPLPISKQESSS